jgi:hypothetical protein
MDVAARYTFPIVYLTPTQYQHYARFKLAQKLMSRLSKAAKYVDQDELWINNWRNWQVETFFNSTAFDTVQGFSYFTSDPLEGNTSTYDNTMLLGNLTTTLTNERIIVESDIASYNDALQLVEVAFCCYDKYASVAYSSRLTALVTDGIYSCINPYGFIDLDRIIYKIFFYSRSSNFNYLVSSQGSFS